MLFLANTFVHAASLHLNDGDTVLNILMLVGPVNWALTLDSVLNLLEVAENPLLSPFKNVFLNSGLGSATDLKGIKVL